MRIGSKGRHKEFFNIEFLVEPELRPVVREAAAIIASKSQVVRKTGTPARTAYIRNVVKCVVEIGEFEATPKDDGGT
ncbi:hypothetical protein N9L68_03885 [bacterium]|nr:hypothetical protein [bacterium]